MAPIKRALCSPRFWALAAALITVAILFTPKNAEADGPCGCHACMGPGGYCIGLQSSICYYGVYFTCQRQFECASLVQTGYCQ